MLILKYKFIVKSNLGGGNLHYYIVDKYYRYIFENSLDAILLTMSQISSTDTIDVNQLVSSVDQLLYKAKQGRNSVYVSE